MKKNIIIAAAAALVLTFTACQKEDLANLGNTPVVPTNSNTGNDAPVSNPRVKSASDLRGTEWIYTFDLSNMVDTNCLPAGFTLTYDFYLNFDMDSAYFTFPTDAVVFNGAMVNGQYEMSEINAKNFAYDYVAATHTGTLTTDDLDDNNSPYLISFTYNDTTDAIIFELMTDDTTTVPLVFNRNE